MHGSGDHLKRAFDLSVALAGLVVLSPLLLGVSVWIRLASGPPVLFRQVRPGRHSRPFTVIKFRTMDDQADGQGVLLPDGVRVSRLGGFLRRTSLDELPQLWNVVRGDMSLVGPRPLLVEYLERYTPDQARRQLVRPGITGWAQIHGRQDLVFSRRLEYDVWYVDHRTFRLDLRILGVTLGRVWGGTGVRTGQDVREVDDLGLAEVPESRRCDE